MKILVLGGTRFLGRAVSHFLGLRGVRATLLHRGRWDADWAPEHEHVLADRNEPLEALQGREFDVIVDLSGQLPAQVERSTRLACGLYLFVSTISVYAPREGESALLDEHSAVWEIPEDAALGEEIPESYAFRKVACEALVRERFPEDHLIVRPGLLGGPGDLTDRLTYWVLRAAQGGLAAAPGSGDDRVRFLDVRDLGQWLVDLALQGRRGLVNAVGPALTMRELLTHCGEVTGNRVEWLWLPVHFLEEHSVQPWQEMPLWLPPPGRFHCVSRERAQAWGLLTRPVPETLEALWQWRGDAPQSLRAGLNSEREIQLLQAWRATCS